MQNSLDLTYISSFIQTAKTLVLTLKKIALAGRTVVCAIHQPRIDIWNEFDNVLLLMTGGRLAYAGKASDAIAYFERAGYVPPEQTNAPDFIIDTVSVNQRSPDLEASSRVVTDSLASAFFASYLLNELPLTLVGSLLLTAIGIFMIGFSLSVETAFKGYVTWILWLTLLAGIMTQNLPWVLECLNYVNPYKYALRILLQNLFQGFKIECTQQEIQKGLCIFSTGEQVLKYLKMEDSNFSRDMLAFNTMGQVNSTQASSSQHVPNSSPPTMPPPPPSSSIPSVEDMRNLTSRILASTGEKLKHLRENIPAIELPASLSSSSSPSSAAVGDTAAQEAGAAAAAVKEGLGFAADTSPVTVMTTADSQVLVFRPFDKNKTSVADLIKFHYFLTLDWFKDNAKTVAVGAVVLGITAVVGTVAVNSLRAHRQKMRRLRVLKSQEGSKREIVVITNVATLEGSILALSLEQEGFIVFVGVPNQAKVDDITQWGRSDIHPVIVDMAKTNPVDDLVKEVSNFLDQHNGNLLGCSTLSLSSSLILEEDLSSSTANIRLINPNDEYSLKSVSEAEAKRRHHGKTDSPLYRLSAVIVNPHSSTIGSIEKVDLDQWRESIESNIIGTVVASQKFLPLLRRTLALAKPRRSPRLIMLSSAVTGSIGFPYQSAICASHHAINSIADSLRREIKPHGIDVVCLRPGVADRSFRKEWSENTSNNNVGGLGLLNKMDPTAILKASFKSASTTAALCDAVYDAITSKKPASSVRVGQGSLSYPLVGWAVPRYVVDWSLKGKAVKIYAPSTVKVTTTSNSREE
ncbi:hypothetical protein BGZ72_011060 [Mortierella alpina]|nr:hypothetical protein BGZ72_011060 [Mortierella alpina]